MISLEGDVPGCSARRTAASSRRRRRRLRRAWGPRQIPYRALTQEAAAPATGDARAARLCDRSAAAPAAPFFQDPDGNYIYANPRLLANDGERTGPGWRGKVSALAIREGLTGLVAVFEPAMQEAVQIRFELESELRRAIDLSEFVLDYQPIVDLRTGELVGAEALVRWDHPTHGRIAPAVFIPLAEETGLIDEIGTWVLRTACTEAARWAQLSPGRVPRVSINVSAHQFADPRLAWTVQTAMARAGAAPSWITLELTESMLMQNSSASIERLHAIRALGVEIAIDDFGTGYSSLAYLERFPVSHIKIDRSFVTPLDDPRRGAGLAHAIVEIGRALGFTTVAEGIETPTQLRRLRELGCVLGQGYLFSRPLDRDAMAKLVGRGTRPLFGRVVGMADRAGMVRTTASDPARVESGARATPSAASSAYPGLRSARVKGTRRASSSSTMKTGPLAASSDGPDSVIPPAGRPRVPPPGSAFRD